MGLNISHRLPHLSLKKLMGGKKDLPEKAAEAKTGEAKTGEAKATFQKNLSRQLHAGLERVKDSVIPGRAEAKKKQAWEKQAMEDKEGGVDGLSRTMTERSIKSPTLSQTSSGLSDISSIGQSYRPAPKPPVKGQTLSAPIGESFPPIPEEKTAKGRPSPLTTTNVDVQFKTGRQWPTNFYNAPKEVRDPSGTIRKNVKRLVLRDSPYEDKKFGGEHYEHLQKGVPTPGRFDAELPKNNRPVDYDPLPFWTSTFKQMMANHPSEISLFQRLAQLPKDEA